MIFVSANKGLICAYTNEVRFLCSCHVVRATVLELARLIGRQEAASFTAPRMADELLLKRSPDKIQRLVVINERRLGITLTIYHFKYSVRNSPDKDQRHLSCQIQCLKQH